jgi:N utilization substance protein A
VSRTHPGLIKRLFEMEVPEIAEGIVELKACAREPGHRTKIAVWSNDANVDPVGACVGARGARVRMVVNELNGEKIDIVPFTDVPQDLVAKALAPAKVKEVRLDYDTGTATVIVPDFQLSLAIGKEGQNARLAARLSGWRVDIKSETQLAEEEAYANQDWAEGEWVTDAETGEQVWQPADGSEALSAEAWAEATEAIEAEAAEAAEGDGEAISVDPDASGDESAVGDEAAATADVEEALAPEAPAADAPATPEAAIAEGAVEDPSDDDPDAAGEPVEAVIPEPGDKGTPT